jgi:hypothetical protein
MFKYFLRAGVAGVIRLMVPVVPFHGTLPPFLGLAFGSGWNYP